MKPQNSLKHTHTDDIKAVKLGLLLTEPELLPTDILTAAAGVGWILAATLKLPPVGADYATTTTTITTACADAGYPSATKEEHTGSLESPAGNEANSAAAEAE